jgi:dihydroneopterin aldolase
VNLVETLAELCGGPPEDKRVMAARVRIEKPDIIPNAKSVGIEIERIRP